ncbi:calcium-translocating P-type ATPase YloB [Gottschalkia acidurici 9a]|uniref:P-type Ca(2+) transporter n=1 Tax=Gottschalkia acidurici (strain ATCC 7906 / DSM 604 / BCRC 14475 / CIP 104303 / KCTC 5404 / NCIMB 10678 / 9a) TaxID=1128398 RepID=K0AYZ7_GOTA9|nr:calcium-translocating P-type ATPase, PMCA-type [Gottschalkia acidurici]AFS77900.1 calcium-translocating P-type ATPase YloB [Gottschalkia acidurici 9a]
MSWYEKDIEELSSELNVDISVGLSEEEVKLRKEKYGENILKEGKRKSIISMFFSQFKDFMVIILLIASIVSGLLGEISDTVIILLVVLLNALLGVIQENKAEKSLEALKSLSSPIAKVIRNGKRLEVKSSELVPGDIILLEAGDFVPADGVLFESASLMIEESALTGESVPVEKQINIPEGENIPLGDRKNYVFTSSLVTNGRGKVIVTETGMNTEIGKIAGMLQNQEDMKTPLQEKLDELGKMLGIGALGICVVIFIIGYLQGTPLLEMFMTSVSLAVAAIPEGLPAIVTVVLSIGVQRMISKNAIIRKLPAVETLGTASVICSDKTGTLTQNKMTVTKLYTYGNLENIEDINISNKDTELALKIGLLCNDSVIETSKESEGGLGDPTEIALVVSASRHGMDKTNEEKKLERVEEIPFDSDRKLMTTVHKDNDGYKVFTKGALDVLLERCKSILIDSEIKDLTEEIKEDIRKVNHEMSEEALRVIALAYKEESKIPAEMTSEKVENDLIFVGMEGMIDPPREEAKVAVEKCKMAGIKPVMITGDHKITAMAIAKELGILENQVEAIEGKEIENMSDEDLNKNVEKYSVYARVSPEHKVRIVSAWQNNGKVVAMTGDGVNDAPALKKANIGCAMGITGTDVSKQAADMILTDDNFATIVSAVEEGRSIFDNIKKSIHFLLSCNIGEVVALFIAVVLGMPIPLLPIHILWVNLVTDSLPALALGMDPAEPDIMKRKPRDPKKSIFAGGLWTTIIVQGVIIGVITLISFNVGRRTSIELGRTMAFITLSLSQIVHTLNVRSIDKSIFKMGLFSNKYLVGADLLSILSVSIIIIIPKLREVFKLTTISGTQLLDIIGLTLTPLIVVEIVKLFKRKIKNRNYFSSLTYKFIESQRQAITDKESEGTK